METFNSINGTVRYGQHGMAWLDTNYEDRENKVEVNGISEQVDVFL